MASPQRWVVKLHNRPRVPSQLLLSVQAAPGPPGMAQWPPAQVSVRWEGLSSPQASPTLPQATQAPLADQPLPAWHSVLHPRAWPAPAAGPHVPPYAAPEVRRVRGSAMEAMLGV